MAIAALLIVEDKVPRADRIVREVDATVRVAHSGAHDALVMNLSVSGCLVDTSIDIVEGDTVSIGINGLGMISGEVIRRKGHTYGLRFSSPLSNAEIAEAGRHDVVVLFRPEPEAAFETSMPNPDRWSRRARLSILLAASGLTWAVIGAIILHFV
jgi:hypothetical protein